ncbi:hypothetical protein [Chromobacterium haemolyticum]|uniref:hypothetical protein n=1 Tax=Chromobacterium haemolyticum TaxID=394935 RepID=UPI001317EFD9|nr:hypothetical protein [Chromobacterium haemolyticum]BBH11730.1 hypothetical protein CH06BL_09780 [Chromobacterium haemolyticum]
MIKFLIGFVCQMAGIVIAVIGYSHHDFGTATFGYGMINGGGFLMWSDPKW